MRDQAQEDPKALINEIRYFDPTTEQWVEFKMFPPEGWEAPDLSVGPAEDWYWQAAIVDWWQDPALKRYLILKARQLGITLLACSRAVWLLCYRPGTASVAFSYNEDEAKKLVEAAWMMYQSLPEVLRNGTRVITPRQSDLPSEWIKLAHPDGKISTFQALPATESAGHGGRLSWVILDEFARQKYGKNVYTAVNPTISRGTSAKLAIVSTANGVSNELTGEGNYFHVLYSKKKEKGLAFQFLPWNLEPSRDEAWYQENAMPLDDVERNQQYPLNEYDAFMLSGTLYFPRDALEFYRREVKKPLFAGHFVSSGTHRWLFTRSPQGEIEVYERPRPDGNYAIGVDSSTGRGTDYTSADVIDLSSGAIVAHLHAKMEAPRAATQIHLLGKWYNNAKIAVERQGGYGEAIIIFLRDGGNGLRPYTNLYRHKRFTSGKQKESDDYGYPMNVGTRGPILENLKTCIRERLFPWVTAGHMAELGTFVYAETTPSPRAMDGCNDDRVMSLALAAELYRQIGTRPHVRKRLKKRPYKPHPARQTA